MELSFILTGLSLGLLGGLHCVGMCGPIALSLPVHRLQTMEKYLSIFLYNFGRAITYAVLGMIPGLLGQSFQFFGLQQALSITAGILMLLFAAIYFFRPHWLDSGKIGVKISSLMGIQMQKEKTYSTFLVIGLINGLLPCGLVYMALVAAFATGSVWKSSALMFFFGIGTLPLMALLMISGKWIKTSTRHLFKKIVPIWITALAIILILRGMNLGIPYLSPMMNQHTHYMEGCCTTTVDK
ncbi:MAG: sulfite exporter TauE/SafE family protein [Chitinophagales bacterium]|nr:sulfite exporter TauE/SafE family protein [Chitinophagales bacterium]